MHLTIIVGPYLRKDYIFHFNLRGALPLFEKLRGCSDPAHPQNSVHMEAYFWISVEIEPLQISALWWKVTSVRKDAADRDDHN